MCLLKDLGKEVKRELKKEGIKITIRDTGGGISYKVIKDDDIICYVREHSDNYVRVEREGVSRVFNIEWADLRKTAQEIKEFLIKLI